jgi:magnesium chelatase accessory protein
MLADIPDDWPNRSFSRVFRGPVHEWHVQDCGTGKRVLLLHGAGGSVHSYRTLLPLLAEHFHVLAPDLPGHGFTRLGSLSRSGLEPMAKDLAALCASLDFRPEAIIGHSAGAAIALRMAVGLPGIRIVGINPALGKFEGVAGVLFPVVAKLLAALPFTARLFSGTAARPDRIRSLIDNTGSHIDPEGIALYQRLISREPHVKGALSMMAQWDLDDLLASLPEVDAPTLFITGSDDQTVPPRVARAAARRMPDARVTELAGYGHLVHEEAPDRVAELCRDFIDPK